MTLVNTGAIIAMWTRDSAAQVNNYIGNGTDLSALAEDVLFMQSFQLANTPYANAYSFTYGKLYRCRAAVCHLNEADAPPSPDGPPPTTIPMGALVQDISNIH